MLLHTVITPNIHLGRSTLVSIEEEEEEEEEEEKAGGGGGEGGGGGGISASFVCLKPIQICVGQNL